MFHRRLEGITRHYCVHSGLRSVFLHIDAYLGGCLLSGIVVNAHRPRVHITVETGGFRGRCTQSVQIMTSALD
jgi:hypothetical protein